MADYNYILDEIGSKIQKGINNEDSENKNANIEDFDLNNLDSQIDNSLLDLGDDVNGLDLSEVKDLASDDSGLDFDLDMDWSTDYSNEVPIDELLVNEDEIKDIFNYITEEIKYFDKLRYAEALLRYKESRQKYDKTSQNEQLFVESLNTSVYTNEDVANTRRLMNDIRLDNEVTLNRINIQTYLPSIAQHRLKDLTNQIIINERISPTEPISTDSKEKILKLLDEIITEISYSIETDRKEQESYTLRNKSIRKPKHPKQYGPGLEKVDVIYTIDHISEVSKSGISENNYYKLNASRSVILNKNLTDKEIMSNYPQKLVITASKDNPDFGMSLEIIDKNMLKSYFDSLCEKDDLAKKTLILKPFFLQKGNIAVIFNKKYLYTDFVEIAEKNLQQNKITVNGDIWIIGTEMTPVLYPDVFRNDISRELVEYPMYSNKELEDYISTFRKTQSVEQIINEMDFDKTQLFKTKTFGKIKLASMIPEYINRYRNEVMSTNTPTVLDVFEKYKLEMTSEYLFEVLKRLKYIVNTKSLQEMTIEDALDMINVFNKENGLLVKLEITDLGAGLTKRLYDALQTHKIDFSDLYEIHYSDKITVSSFQKSKHSYGSVINSYSNAELLLKGFVENSKDNQLSLIENNNIDNKIEINGDNMNKGTTTIEEYHFMICEQIIKNIFDSCKIKEDEFAKEVAKQYVNSIKAKENSNNNDAHIYLRSGVNHVELTEEQRILRERLETYNLEKFKNGKLLEFQVVDDKLKSIIKSINTNITDELLDKMESTDFIKDISAILALVNNIETVTPVIESVFKVLSESYIDNYKKGTLLDKISVTSNNVNTNIGDYTISLTNEINKNYTFTTIENGINRLSPYSVERDKTFLASLFTDKVLDAYNPEKPKRFQRLVNMLLEKLLKDEPETLNIDGKFDNEEIKIDLDALVKNTEYKINLVTTNYPESNYIISRLNQILYYQGVGFLTDEVNTKMEGVKYYEKDKNYQEVTNVVSVSSMVTILSEILDYRLGIHYTKTANEIIEEIKSKMESVTEDSAYLPEKNKKRQNAMYKVYLTTGNTDVLKSVNRDYVDFELLTKEPKADGIGGGEFSQSKLIEEYELVNYLFDSEELDNLDYFYTILTLEKFQPDIINYLPKPIMEYMETPIEIPERFRNDELLKETKFNIQII